MTTPTHDTAKPSATEIPAMTLQQKLYLFILCLGVALYALNSMITSTLLPSAVKDLQGVAYINWTVLVYTMAAMMASLSGGAFKNRVGGRRALFTAGGIFALGTVCVALAPNMPLFLVARFVQGLGGGLVLAACYTVIADLFPRALWPTVFAMESATWGAAALGGPLIGGLFAEYIGWREAFYTTAAAALVFMIAVQTAFPAKARADQQPGEGSKRHVPLMRMAVLAVAVLAAATAGQQVAYALPLLGLAALAVVVLLRLDRRATVPLLPRRGTGLTQPVGAGLATVFIALASSVSFMIYGPYLLQHNFDLSPLAAGYFVALEAMGWTGAAMVTARLCQQASWRPWLIPLGVVIALLGIVGIALFLYSGPLWLLAASVLLAGAGFGCFWADLCSLVIETGDRDEQDLRSSAIPTVQMGGTAFGPALVGIVAALCGFAEGASEAALAATAFWVNAAFVPTMALAGFFALIVIRRKNVPAATAPAATATAATATET